MIDGDFLSGRTILDAVDVVKMRMDSCQLQRLRKVWLTCCQRGTQTDVNISLHHLKSDWLWR